MFSLERDNDTICAVSTAQGVGAVAMVRVSGMQALDFVRASCPFLPAKPESHRVYYGFIKEQSTGEKVDEILVTYFAKGRSFTGEQSVEICCHGGLAISQMVLGELIANGCRLAHRGEFTYRAFMNGRIDLVQAESVLALIESHTKSAARMALRQLDGELSKELVDLEDKMTLVLAHLEANIDFAHEDIELSTQDQLLKDTETALAVVDKKMQTYQLGRTIKEGLKVAVVGRPNVGKSSLLNRLLGEDKAIVTDIAGTTRDLIEGSAIIDGIQLNFVDSAGLHESLDPVEVMGMERARTAAETSDVILLVIDLQEGLTKADLKILESLPGDRIVFVGNKLDLKEQAPDKFALISGYPQIWVSCKTGSGIDGCLAHLVGQARQGLNEDAGLVSQARHFELLGKTREQLVRTIDLMKEAASPEFVIFELKEGLVAVQEILGKQYDDQIMDRVFNEFCLGK